MWTYKYSYASQKGTEPGRAADTFCWLSVATGSNLLKAELNLYEAGTRPPGIEM